MTNTKRDYQFYRFCAYGFLKNLRFFDIFLLLYLRESGLNFTLIGTLYAIREGVANVMEIPSGIASDTYGRKYTLMFSFVLYILSFVLMYYGSSFSPYAAAFVLYGLAEAFRSGTNKGMIMDHLRHMGRDDERISYYGKTRSCSQTGSAVSSLLAPALVVYTGSYDVVFLAAIVPYVLNFINVASYPSYLQHSSRAKSQGLLRAYQQNTRHLIHLLQNPRVATTVFSAALHTGWVKAVQDYMQIILASLPPLLLLRQNPANPEAWAVGMGYFVVYIASATASRSADKVKGHRPMTTAWLLMIAGFALSIAIGLFFRWSLAALSFVCFVLLFVIENLRKPLLTGVLADRTPLENLTSVLSAQSLLRTLITMLLAPLLGWLVDTVGVGSGIAALAMLLTLLAIAAYKPLSR